MLAQALRLEPFDPAHAPTVSSWARSADEVRVWCSRTDVPVPAEVVAGWSAEPDVTAWTLWDGDDMVGYGETWVDDDEQEVELARLIIAPERRGRGVGRAMVELLTEQAGQVYSAVIVRVHEDNQAALRCYATAGFDRVDAAEQEQWNRGQPVAYVWMSHREQSTS